MSAIILAGKKRRQFAFSVVFATSAAFRVPGVGAWIEGSVLGSLAVPQGEEAFPIWASTSPFLSIPRTPVPLRISLSTAFSCRRRRTEGKSGRVWEGPAERWEEFDTDTLVGDNDVVEEGEWG
jgi:hypothetical protein